VVFAHSVLPSLYGRLALPLFGARPSFVTVLHCATNDDFSDKYLRSLERLTRWRVDHIVAVSEQGAVAYRRRFGERRPVEVIRNGIEFGRFNSVDREKARAALGVRPQTKLLLQVGRISPVKQQDFSIRALKNLLTAEQCELWLAGLTESSAYAACIREQIAQLGLDRRVKLLGSRSDIPELLAASDLFLMPSTDESQGIALLEALVSGVPIVASTIQAFQFANQLDGVRLIDPSDEAGYLLAARALLKAPRVARSIGEYNIERTAFDYISLAKRLLTGRQI
jgi:glycosyltransferase involved in cell wall biosynthesis